MRRLSFVLPLLAGVAIAPAIRPHVAVAQKSAMKEAKSEEAVVYSGRLPNYYAKAGVTDEQRQEIYKIQTEYAAQIDPLLAEIEDMRADRDAEVADVLTDEQSADVKKMRAEARAKRRQR